MLDCPTKIKQANYRLFIIIFEKIVQMLQFYFQGGTFCIYSLTINSNSQAEVRVTPKILNGISDRVVSYFKAY